MEPELRKTVELALAGDRAAFEALVASRFRIARHDDDAVMATYFLERR